MSSEKKLIKNAWIIFIVVLAICLALQFVMHPHTVFGIEGTLFFNAWYGFLSCAAIVIFSKFLGFFLKKPEDYYHDGEEEND